MPGVPLPTLTAHDTGFVVEAHERIDYSLAFVDGVFRLANTELAELYRPWGRCLMVVDETVHDLYGDQLHAYFEHHGIALTVFPIVIGGPARRCRRSNGSSMRSARSVWSARSPCWSSAAD